MLVSVGACTPTYAPVTDLRPFKNITVTCKDAARTRKQVVAHNSVLDSLKRGKKIIYRDGCPVEAPTS